MPYIPVLESNDKDEIYKYISNKLDLLIKKETNFIANLANFSALLGMQLKSINWAGFYLLDNNELVLGPFYGKPAVTRIKIGSGVCGTAIKENNNQIVPNVCKFPGHITCDIVSKSEIVIVIKKNNKILGVLDLDSSVLNNFNKMDEKYLTDLVLKVIEKSVIK